MEDEDREVDRRREECEAADADEADERRKPPSEVERPSAPTGERGAAALGAESESSGTSTADLERASNDEERK